MRVDMRLNMQSPPWATRFRRYTGRGFPMAKWADEQGLNAIRIGEHHGTEDNWCPSITALGAAVAAVTERITVNLSAVLLPLHDPVHVAEDLAVLDIMCDGRLQVVVPADTDVDEFEMFGVDRKRRGALTEEAVEVLPKAWTGESFEYRGRKVRVTPKPSTPGGPPLILGGSSGAAAKRAVRLDMDYFPLNKEAYEVYQEERVRTGLPRAEDLARRATHDARCRRCRTGVEDARTHVVAEATNYVHWSSTDTPTSGPLGVKVPTLEDLRAGGRYLVVTPDEAIDIVRGFAPDTILTLHPLVAGLEPEVGWQSLHLFAERVLPAIREMGGVR